MKTAIAVYCFVSGIIMVAAGYKTGTNVFHYGQPIEPMMRYYYLQPYIDAEPHKKEAYEQAYAKFTGHTRTLMGGAFLSSTLIGVAGLAQIFVGSVVWTRRKAKEQ